MSPRRVIPLRPAAAPTGRDARIVDLIHGPAYAGGAQRRIAELQADLVATGSISELRAARAYAWIHARYHAGRDGALSVNEFLGLVTAEEARLRQEYAAADVWRGEATA